MFKRIIILIGLIYFIFPVVEVKASVYKDQHTASGSGELEYALPDETREFMNKNGLNTENEKWTDNLTVENVFTHIFSFLKSGAKAPITATLSIIAVTIISSAITANTEGDSVSRACLYATALSAAALICIPVFSTINAAVNAMRGCAAFMSAFIPIFAVVVASSTGISTSVSMSAVLLYATQVVSYICNFVITPLMGGYLALSVTASASPIIENSGIANGIKKLSFWIMSLLTTIFIGILSIQTAVNTSVDTLTVKTAKFIIGAAVPVAGTALSEALTTVTASMGLLKSSIGVYGVIACVLIFLPLLLELFLWRVGFIVSSAIAELFGVSKVCSLIKSVDSVVAVLIGILLLTLAMFVISLAVVITVGKS